MMVREQLLENVLANAGGLFSLLRHGPADLFGAKKVPQYSVAFGNTLRRKGLAHIVEIVCMIAIGQGLHEIADILGIGGIALQSGGKGRHQRLHRLGDLVFLQSELFCHGTRCFAILRLHHHF